MEYLVNNSHNIEINNNIILTNENVINAINFCNTAIRNLYEQTKEFDINILIILSILFLLLFKYITLFNFKFPLVNVPVLSRHKVSTLDKFSIEYKFLISTLYLDSLMIPSANTELVRRINPFGIIPTIAATVLVIDWAKSSDILNCFKNNSIPSGAIKNAINLIILFKLLIIDDWFFLIYLLSITILLA